MNNQAENYRAALEFANEVREHLGEPGLASILPGRACQSDDCPIARTIRYGMDNDVVVSTGVGINTVSQRKSSDRRGIFEVDLLDRRALPREASQFVYDFDDGHYPELDIDKQEKGA